MKLYYSPGACSLASHIALREAGASFEIEKVDTKAKRTASGDDYRAINPKGYVPALKFNDGEVLTEGPAILQFIADQNPAANLAPKPGTRERARVNSHLNFVGSELHKAFTPLFSGKQFTADERAEIDAKIASKLDIMESALSNNGPFLTGDAFTIADAYLFVVASWGRHVGVDLAKWPRVAALVRTVGARPAAMEAMRAEGIAA
ncbi:MAG: glutathione transferase GstA [Pseudomonadota bacterium]|nr:glutathione transferase GstA [Pseudomonadota bacterium]